MPAHHHDRLTGQAWALFAAMSVIWGLPYLFIKIAVEQIPPSAVVLGRTGLAALVLVPVALHSGALRAAARHWRPVAVFAVLEMGIPWLLLGHAEQRISSALAGLLLAAVPIIGAVVLAMMTAGHWPVCACSGWHWACWAWRRSWGSTPWTAISTA